MVDPEDAEYVCSLTEYSVQKAKEELNEDPDQRLAAVQALRTWIRQQPHYTCRTDTRFLLNFLRRAKFSQLEARTIIDNFLCSRTTYPEYMANIDLQDPEILSYIERGIIFAFPKPDKDGRTIVLARPAKLDVNDPTLTVIGQIKCTLALIEMLLDADENVSVNGFITIYDCTRIEFRHLTRTSTEQNKMLKRIFQDNIPIRIKAYYFFNGGALLEMVMGLVKAFLTKKNQERVQTHDAMESLYKVIPKELWPTEYLPTDYTGPSAGPIENIVADLKKRMLNPEARDRILANTSDKYKVNGSKRPTDGLPTKSFLRLNIN